MGAGVVLDTSFLITLADSSRDNHKTALQYWKHFIEEHIPVFLPTIVVSEFCVKQEIPSSILRCCIVLPFNWDEAIMAADLDFKQHVNESGERAAVKDDIKIIAQAAVTAAQYIISEDRKTLLRVIGELNQSGRLAARPINLRESFDRSHFNADHQGEFIDTLNSQPGQVSSATATVPASVRSASEGCV